MSEEFTGHWRFSIPPGPSGQYRLAQLDDYRALKRSQFRWTAPQKLTLRARVSSINVPGTWGFGFWNDPFTLSMGLGGMARRFPALPDAAWFFFASPENYLSLRDDLPAQGFLAATFRSSAVPAPVLACGALALPLLAFPPAARLARPVLRAWIRQDAARVPVDPQEWHDYELEWQVKRVRLAVDGQEILATGIAPQGRLGLVIWIDNQFAAFSGQGSVRFGALENPLAAWLEIEHLHLASQVR